jgi:hypothetical protein
MVQAATSLVACLYTNTVHYTKVGIEVLPAWAHGGFMDGSRCTLGVPRSIAVRAASGHPSNHHPIRSHRQLGAVAAATYRTDCG